MIDATRSWRARWPLRIAVATAGVVMSAAAATGQNDMWLRGPAQGSGTPDGAVRAMEVIGPSLVLGGEFTQVGGISMPNLAMWDGWSYAVPLRFSVNGEVFAMTVHNGELIVGGRFTMAGDLAVSNIARWNPATDAWSTLAGPLGEGVEGTVFALRSHGEDLYVGGQFTAAGGAMPADNIAVWDQSEAQWTPLNGGVDGAVRSLVLYQEPAGERPAVFVGGDFLNADNMLTTIPVNHIARWRPGMPLGVWSAVGLGLAPGVNDTVRALAVYQEGGSPPALFVGGDFTTAGGMGIAHLARWNGAAWSAIDPFVDREPDGPVHALRVQGARLVLGGEFTQIGGEVYRHVAGWDGLAWSVIGTPGRGLDGPVYALAEFNDGQGPDLIAGGAFPGTDPAVGRAAYIADLETTVLGEEWTIPSAGLNGPVLAWARYGGQLYATGEFTVAAGRPVNYIARWDGLGWLPVAQGLNGPGRAMLVYSEPSGAVPRLFVGGDLTRAGGVDVSYIAAWDGDDLGWSAVDTGRPGPVYALAEYRSLLFAGGELIKPFGAHLGYWDGALWTEFLNDVNGPVYALAEMEDPPGDLTYLLVGGEFTQAGSESAAGPHLAAWLLDTGGWSMINGGQPDAPVRALLAPRTPDVAPSFYAGGDFIRVGPDPLIVNRIARWSGGSWFALGEGLLGGPVHALALHEDTLIAGGDFTSTGLLSLSRIGMWRADQWTPMDTGMDDSVRAITAYGREIMAGGAFTLAGDRISEYWARWGLCRVDFNSDGLVDFLDFLEFFNFYDTGDPRADINGDGLIDFVDFLEFLNLYEIGC